MIGPAIDPMPGHVSLAAGDLERSKREIAMFDGFKLEMIELPEATLRVRHGGNGPPILLLHGHPRTHATWHRVAPLLAASHTVICPDLRGFGKSSKPADMPAHEGSSKRAKARDCVALMEALGFPTFAVAGHDRGCYVAYRTALDHPERVSKLAVLDGIPILERLERCDARFAQTRWHWFFCGQPDNPERAITADPDAWYGASAQRTGANAYADFLEAIHDPATVHGMVEDYRVGLGIDRDHDAQDREQGRRIACPALCLWSLRDGSHELAGDMLGIWRSWASDVRGRGIDCTHHMAEEAPEALARELLEFLDQNPEIRRRPS